MRSRVLVLLGLLTLALSGCGLLGGGVYDTDLPGGADLGDDPITLTADFRDVLDLVPQSSVKVDNVPVGQVSEISLNEDGRSAEVEIKVNGSVELPVGTDARLQQTSLLGEKYIALIRPDQPTQGELEDGAHIGLARTSQAAEVEQVLGALSLVLNGGGVARFQEISRELQQISAGRPRQIKTFLREIAGFVGGLESRKEAITSALDGLDRLGRALDRDKAKIVKALEELSPGMEVIVDQRKQLVSMLSSLDRLSKVTVSTLNQSQADMVADLKAMEPILKNLAEAGADLPNALQIMLTYPFPDSVLGAIKGDYFNVFITTNFRTPSNCGSIGCPWAQPVDDVPVTPPDGARQEGLTLRDLPTDLPTDLPSPEPSEEPSPTESGSPSETTSPSESTSPSDGGSPTLLPPTDSPLPGYPSASVTVPSESAAPNGSASTGGGD